MLDGVGNVIPEGPQTAKALKIEFSNNFLELAVCTLLDTVLSISKMSSFNITYHGTMEALLFPALVGPNTEPASCNYISAVSCAGRFRSRISRCSASKVDSAKNSVLRDIYIYIIKKEKEWKLAVLQILVDSMLAYRRAANLDSHCCCKATMLIALVLQQKNGNCSSNQPVAE